MVQRARQLHLDGIRGLAILSVVVWHYISTPLQFERLSVTGDFPVGLLAFAWAGVDVFFVLSGLLITEILWRARQAENYFQVFFFRRVCRLLPLYLVVLFSFWAARFFWRTDEILSANLQNAGVPDWTFMLGVQNLWMAAKTSFGPGWLAPTWSLAAEVQFYLFWALLLRHGRLRLIWMVVLAGILSAPAIRSLLPPLVGYVTLLGRVDAFLAGGLVALVLQSPRARLLCLGTPKVVNYLTGVAILGAVVMLYQPQAFGAVTPWYGTFTHSWILGTTAAVILYLSLNEQNLLGRLLSQRLLVGLGSISYGLYLFHQPVRYLVFRWWLGCAPQLDNLEGWFATGLAFVVSVVLSTICYWTIEQGFISLGRRVDYRPGKPAKVQETTAASAPVLSKML